MKHFFMLVALLGTMIGTAHAQYNVVKWGADGLINLRIDLEYERAISRRMSLGLEFNALIPRQVPVVYRGALSLANAGAGSYSLDVNNSNWNVFAVIPQFRVYLTNMDAPNGFYVGPYLKGKWRGITINGTYADDSNNTITASVSGGATTYGGGGQLGYQAIINQRFAIDVLLGFGLDVHTLHLSFVSDDINADYSQWEQTLEGTVTNIPYIGNQFKFTSGSDFLRSNFTFLFPAFRFGVSLGYAF